MILCFSLQSYRSFKKFLDGKSSISESDVPRKFEPLPTFSICSEPPFDADYMKSELGNKYRTGSVYGHFMNYFGNAGDQYFDIWTMGNWNSFCITSNSKAKTLKVYLNGKIVAQYHDFTGFPSLTTRNIILLNELFRT